MKLTFSSYSLTDLANMADNREHYRTRIKSPDISLKEHKSLDETLKYLEQFPPGVEHFKVKAQKFEIYSVEDVIWKASNIIHNKMSNQCGEQKSKLIYPVGKDRLIHSVDFGNLVYASAGKPVEKLLEKNVKYYLNGNEFILGDRYTVSALGNIEFPPEYFEVVSETIDQDYMIIYKLKKKIIIEPTKPLKFKIHDYFEVDGIRLSEKIVMMIPYFSSDHFQFEQWRFRKV